MSLNTRKHAAASPLSHNHARVALSTDGRIRLHLPELFSRSDLSRLREFLRRVFSIAEVNRVDLIADQGITDIYCRAACDLQRAAAGLARAMTGTSARDERSMVKRLWLGGKPRAPLKIFRYRAVLTTWQIAHELAGRLRLRHDLLFRDPEMVLFFEEELAAVDGVTGVKGRPQTGSLLVEYDATTLDRETLLHIVEQLLHDYHAAQGHAFAAAESSSVADNGALALAAMADFVFPALMPASAALLVFTQRGNIKTAARDLVVGRPSLPLLYTTIVAGTLANGAFFAAAAMGWFMTFWDRRYHRRVAVAQRQVLRPLAQRTSEVRILRGDTETMPFDQLRVGQVVAIEAGESVCVDGMVIAGEGVVDERFVQGSTGPVAKLQGDWVYAGSRLREGSLKVRVTRTGDGTRAAAIAAILRQASTPAPSALYLRGETFARRAVLPTFAAAGAGLAVGDLTTALAVLRPDYASGPGMAIPLGTLEDLHEALASGIVVRDASLFERLRAVDLIVLDVHDEWAAQANRLGNDDPPLAWADSLRACRDARVVVVSGAPGSEVEPLRRRLGADFCCGDQTPAAKAELIERCSAAGHHVAYVGDCEANARAARSSYVAISTFDFSHDQPSAAAFLMQPECARVGKLWEIALGRQRRNQVTYGCTLAPNLACVAGALLLDFSVLSAVLISNLGVLAAYRNVTGWLSRRNRKPRGTKTSPQVRHSIAQDDVQRSPGIGSANAGTSGQMALHPHKSSTDVLLEQP
jgi:cation transport ATPase